MNSTQSNAEKLLYTDEAGELVGLDEVQLLDPIPAERTPALRALLKGDDAFLAYQAALVLAAWGDDAGLDYVERLIDSHAGEEAEFAPDRLTGEDNIYDELAYAVHLYGVSCPAMRQTDRKRIYGKLLDLYGTHYFRSQLKYALLKSDFAELQPKVEEAMKQALAQGRVYQASQLLPVLARWDAAAAERWFAPFEQAPAQTPDPRTNIAEALGHIDTAESRARLTRLAREADSVTADEARAALKRNNIHA